MERLDSLDALRGFDMMFIMGMGALITAVCTLFSGGNDCWVVTTLEHCEWDGLHFIDTVFPLFLFIAGISFPFSYEKQQKKGFSKRQTYCKIFRRLIIMIVLGLIYNGWLSKPDWHNLRIYSVLGRIGLAWAIAAVLYMNCKRHTRVSICVLILLGYWLVLMLVPAPDASYGEGPLSMMGNIVGYIDRTLFPTHLYHGGPFDPEGLLSTLPAVVTALLGMFAGEIVQRKDISGNRKAVTMLCLAAVLLTCGLLWSSWCPINKRLWSSSFTLVVAAYSFAIFAVFYWIIDVKRWNKWILPFKVIGLNSITIYMLQGVVTLMPTSKYLLGFIGGNLSDDAAKVVYAAGYFLISWLILYFLYRKKIFLKI